MPRTARYSTSATAALDGVRFRALHDEPTVAAISYARDVPIPGRFLVEEQNSRRITALGGLEFDNALAKLIQQKIGLTADQLTKAERRR
ncbi:MULTISPECIES: hypothetical protein [Streptomyces]|uniref:Uncharacterized protein n=1 Tax=Streptomyces rubiginosohelvolus TaxID=67362 RepID=A0ABQ3BS89_9ACTN|nr:MULTISPECIES: hypothetical protein [Streptomyces]RUP64635.1 hypothetical protein SSPNP10_28360 [Streptomyces sp. NP10]GGS05436.1 hypothetical protein GCM10010284_43260 [Streptomyces rubiginosohelvolus]GGZ55955.1 hypothetical protein GCM10010328_33400 [Streptomyces pluricolorescens]